MRRSRRGQIEHDHRPAASPRAWPRRRTLSHSASRSDEFAELERRVAQADARLLAWHRANPTSRRLAAIPGVGPVTAALLAMKVTRRRSPRAGISPRSVAEEGAVSVTNAINHSVRRVASVFTRGQSSGTGGPLHSAAGHQPRAAAWRRGDPGGVHGRSSRGPKSAPAPCSQGAAALATTWISRGQRTPVLGVRAIAPPRPLLVNPSAVRRKLPARRARSP